VYNALDRTGEPASSGQRAFHGVSRLRVTFLLRGVDPMPETVVHFQIRMPPVLHEQLASWAKEDKASLNALIVGILEKAIEQHNKAAQAG
jgi:predicted HicB family RNase H-like nuclease